MSHKSDPWPVATLRFKGVFDYDGLCRFVTDWFVDRKWEVNEKADKHKLSCPKGFEIERELEADIKVNTFYKYKAQVRYNLFDAHQVEVVKDGKKQKLWEARMQVVIMASIEMDYESRWESSPFWIKLRRIYINYVIKKDMLYRHMDPFHFKLYGLFQEMKKFIGMEAHGKW
jgi:hypothetical protein